MSLALNMSLETLKDDVPWSMKGSRRLIVMIEGGRDDSEVFIADKGGGECRVVDAKVRLTTVQPVHWDLVDDGKEAR